MTFIDSNIWLYFANDLSAHHGKIKTFLQPFLKTERDFAVSWQIFYEFIRTITDPRTFEGPLAADRAFDFMNRVFQFPNATILQEGPSHQEALKNVMVQSGFKQGYFIHDCHIAALLQENGIRTIITADHDFRRFPFLEVVDPTNIP